MPKEFHLKNQQQIRERISQLAARMIAQDGVHDYSLAKRKAARELGVTEITNLPGNKEIEQAVRAYQSLYQKDEHQVQLQALRKLAYSFMQRFEKFNPYLVGPVLNGTATWNSSINILLVTDSAKEVELFLLNRNFPFKSGIKRIRAGNDQREVPMYALLEEGAAIELAVVSPADLHAMPKNLSERETLERAKASQLILLIEQFE